MAYHLKFISQENFEKHVTDTILSYSKSLESISLAKFNSNIIDPIKMLFDKNVFSKSYEQLIADEIFRQRDKSNNNSIGYFHQNIFKYIRNCEVPKTGWDVIYTSPETGRKIYAELKNKHNTMNSGSAQKIYIQMQNQIMKTPEDVCFLVETIAPKSRNIPWGCSVNGQHVEDERIRRVSMDKFYAIVTGEQNAFCQMCMQLPETLEILIKHNRNLTAGQDTVLSELQNLSPDIQKALFLLAFRTYEGFSEKEGCS